MEILVCIFSVWVLIRSISYAVFEYKVNKNVVGAVSVALFNVITFVFINIMLYLN